MPGVRICIVGGGSAFMAAMFAAVAHPVHRDLDVIERVIAGRFEAHRAHLPRFFPPGRSWDAGRKEVTS